MESLAVLAVVVLFTSLIGGPTALLLTYLPNKPKSIRFARTSLVIVLSLVGILFGVQLVLGSSIPLFPRLIGAIGLFTSILALLYEFKVLKRRVETTQSESHSTSLENLIESTDIASAAESASSSKKYAVIFKSKRQDDNYELYYEHNNALDEKIKSLPGYIEHFGIRNPETREGVTVAYFDSLEAIDQWRKDKEHIDAKKLAKSDFYENYQVEITEVIDKYGWDGQ